MNVRVFINGISCRWTNAPDVSLVGYGYFQDGRIIQVNGKPHFVVSARWDQDEEALSLMTRGVPNFELEMFDP